jgi:type I restriction enzyme M protein
MEELALFEPPDDGGRDGEQGAPASLPEDATIDYITGKAVKNTPKERVRQHIARALFHEYGIAVEDMQADFAVSVTGSGRGARKKADIAVFAPGRAHIIDNLDRVVICRPEPTANKNVIKLRDHEQAKKDLEELKLLMGDDKSPCRYGLWTNGLDMFFLHKENQRFGAEFEPRADWPQADVTVGSRDVASHARLRRAEPERLRMAFHRCHRYIHGNEGMPKDAAFWQFLYLLFAKMHDEQVSERPGGQRRFYARAMEPFEESGQREIRKRIEDLFAEVKTTYPLFDDSDRIKISNRALGFLVAELAPYDLSGTDIDAKGAAYQELVGDNLRGDRGQYFTPRSAVEFMVNILDPQEDETVLDPACGTGGFLRETLKHLLNRWREDEKTLGLPDTDAQREEHRSRLARYASKHLFGADFDPFLVRATSMNIMTLAGIEGNIYHMDSLAFPGGHLPDAKEAFRAIPPNKVVDIVLTNPPFGADIPITDPDTLDHYRADGVARSWSRSKGSTLLDESEKPVVSMAPEQLFIQRAVEWVHEGGRVGIVLPNGILSNPGPMDEAIRRWILEHCWVLASVELPMETFVAEANVNIITSMLFLKKKTREERMAGSMGAPQDYPVFMAVAERVGFDRRGNPAYKRHADGERILEEQQETERIRLNGNEQVRTLRRMQPVLDNDLPIIVQRYREFRALHPEPGLPRHAGSAAQ